MSDFTRTHARTTDDGTCFDAAAKNAPNASRRVELVLEFVRSRGGDGATHKEVIAYFGGNRSMRRRLSDNVVRGTVVKNGERRDGCNVYVAADLGDGA